MAYYCGCGPVRGAAGLIFIIATMNFLVIIISLVVTNAKEIQYYEWVSHGAHATFYGEPGDTPDTMGGACGYGAKTQEWYGSKTAALSTALFDKGAACGGCYELKCVNEANWKFCLPGSPTVTVTATNYCPPNDALPSDNGGWCNPPRHHFDLDVAAWETIGKYDGGIVAVQYRRVPCKRDDTVMFTIDKRNDYFYLVLISNVGGAGVVTKASYSTDNINWKPMSRNWGQNWEITQRLVDHHPLSFRVTTEDQDTQDFIYAVPFGWAPGLNYKASSQF